jgi:hypothetical protein
MNGANRHDGCGSRIYASGDDGLECRDERGGADDGIRGLVGVERRVHPSGQFDLEPVRRRGERARVGNDLADGKPTIHVAAEDGPSHRRVPRCRGSPSRPSPTSSAG